MRDFVISLRTGEKIFIFRTVQVTELGPENHNITRLTSVNAQIHDKPNLRNILLYIRVNSVRPAKFKRFNKKHTTCRGHLPTQLQFLRRPDRFELHSVQINHKRIEKSSSCSDFGTNTQIVNYFDCLIHCQRTVKISVWVRTTNWSAEYS